MSMRTAIAPLVGLGLGLGLTSIAGADTFSGFSGVDRPYLVNQDRVCTPIVVAGGAAAGAPKCTKVAADTIAQLSIKPPLVQSGARASFAAQAVARTITVTRKNGGPVVAWDAPDPVVRIVEVYASQYDDRVAVAYVVRRAGKEVSDVVAFDLGKSQPGDPPAMPAAPAVDPSAKPADPNAKPADTANPKLVKALADARATPKPRALVAWRAVIALDGAQPEALFHIAAAEVSAKHLPEALAALTTLAASPQPEAIEWLIEARFDPAFAPLRAEPKYRATVGLDRKPTTTYERFLGFGGQWEQNGTSCDKPEIRFAATRDRHFKLRVKTTCEGTVYDTPFKGTWRVDGGRIVLALPNQGKVSAEDEAACGFEVAGDEDAMRCTLGKDLDFVVLPTRR